MSDTNDKEMLVMAAKAAGIRLEWIGYASFDCTKLKAGKPTCKGVLWNPLVDDGDALRLAVNLNLFNGTAFYKFRSLERFSGQDADDITATRRAITRAAAAIGRAML